MIRVLGTVFAALLGMAFGSFLNVCLSRWPQGESIVSPSSHCRTCGRVLRWWENVPLLSWTALHGRCRGCGSWIGWRYPIVEAAVGGLWALVAWRALDQFAPDKVQHIETTLPVSAAAAVALAAFLWLMVALAALDAESLWLPDFLTLPGIAIGLLVTFYFSTLGSSLGRPELSLRIVVYRIAGVLASAGVILAIRGVYWLLRRREGIGLGDAKLMALLAAWLGLPGALLAFAIGILLGAALALVVLVLPKQQGHEPWGLLKLPLGTFLSIGGIVAALWGEPIIAAYLRWAGL